MKPLILASASQTRSRLLRAAGVDFEVVPANIDEAQARTKCAEEGSDKLAQMLAERKAREVAAKRRGRYVLGADQVLDFKGKPLGKCATLAEAEQLLKRLRGRKHLLVTSAVLVRDGKILWTHAERSRLLMRKFTDAFLAQYIAEAGAAILDAVGCFQIEGLGAQLFREVEGDFFSVLGLPLLPLLDALRKRGLMAT